MHGQVTKIGSGAGYSSLVGSETGERHEGHLQQFNGFDASEFQGAEPRLDQRFVLELEGSRRQKRVAHVNGERVVPVALRHLLRRVARHTGINKSELRQDYNGALGIWETHLSLPCPSTRTAAVLRTRSAALLRGRWRLARCESYAGVVLAGRYEIFSEPRPERSIGRAWIIHSLES